MGEAPEMTTARDAAGFRDPATGELRQETMIINMGPQHPSTHGVLRLVLELDGETVIHCKPVIGYLHTGIEKNTEYRTWMQGVTYVTRADYLSPFFNELAYCLGVERLLGVEAPERATLIRILVCELNRITSHLVWLATSGLELGAVSVMLYGFREREVIMEIFEAITGLRMNHAYIRIGGVVMDLPDEGPRRIRSLLDLLPGRIDEYETLLMRYDLAEVLKNPLRFAAQKAKHAWDDPRAVPSKTIDYAKYDLVRALNRLVDALGLAESAIENLLAQALAVPASRFLRMKRSVDMLVSDSKTPGCGVVIEGTYQAPIMVQWRRADRGERQVNVTLTRFV